MSVKISYFFNYQIYNWRNVGKKARFLQLLAFNGQRIAKSEANDGNNGEEKLFEHGFLLVNERFLAKILRGHAATFKSTIIFISERRLFN